MALITCPECGGKISDKCNACIHCGYPINYENSNAQTVGCDSMIENLIQQTKTFFDNFDISKFDTFCELFRDNVEKYKRNIDVLDKEESLSLLYDKIAILLLEGYKETHLEFNINNTTKLFGLIDFSCLSTEVMNVYSKYLYDEISFVEYYPDGSSGNSEDLMLWYPIYQIVKHSNGKYKYLLIKVLSSSYAFGKSKYISLLENAKTTLNETIDESIFFPKDIPDFDFETPNTTDENEDAINFHLLRLEKDRNHEIIAKIITVIISISFTLLFIVLFFLQGNLFFKVISFIVAAIGWFLLYFTSNSVKQIDADIRMLKQNPLKYEQILEDRFKIAAKQAQFYNQINHPKCPLCGSTNTKRISNIDRTVSVGMLGIASSKIGKQYECNDCKHKW